MYITNERCNWIHCSTIIFKFRNGLRVKLTKCFELLYNGIINYYKLKNLRCVMQSVGIVIGPVTRERNQRCPLVCVKESLVSVRALIAKRSVLTESLVSKQLLIRWWLCWRFIILLEKDKAHEMKTFFQMWILVYKRM